MICRPLHVQVGDLRDDHNYPDAKASGATQTRANVAGEYGGLGTFVDGHTWVDSSDKVFKAYPLMDNTTQFQVIFASLQRINRLSCLLMRRFSALHRASCMANSSAVLSSCRNVLLKAAPRSARQRSSCALDATVGIQIE